MNDTQKKALVTIIVIVVAVALLYGLRWFVEKFPPRQQETAQQQNAPTANESAAQSTATVPTQPVTRPANGNNAYQQALDKYAFRIQFKDCHGIGEPPAVGGSLALKKGTPLMLDNRDKIAHTIAFKGVSVKVGAENFAIVTPTVLGIYNVTCDGGGSASLNVQQ